jgi:hypothetical protein
VFLDQDGGAQLLADRDGKALAVRSNGRDVAMKWRKVTSPELRRRLAFSSLPGLEEVDQDGCAFGKGRLSLSFWQDPAEPFVEERE